MPLQKKILEHMRKIVFVLLLSILWSGCNSEDEEVRMDEDQTEDEQREDEEENDDDGDEMDGPRTYEEALSLFNILVDSLRELGLTRERTFPTTGVRTYSGFHQGDFRAASSTSTTEIAYVADVVFELDFASGRFTGEMGNFSTDLEGFENPEGVLSINGAIRDLSGDRFGLSFRIVDGDLTQGNLTARFDAVTNTNGSFSGQDAQMVAVASSSTFDWTSGPDEGTSATIGTMIAIAVEL